MRNRVLWRHHSALEQQSNGNNNRHPSPNHNTEDAYKRRRQQEEIDFQRVRSLPMSEILKDQSNSAYYDEHSPSLVITTPPQRTILELLNESLIVGYYFALHVALFAVFREVVIYMIMPFIPSYAYISSSLVTLYSYKWWRGEIFICYPNTAMCESFFA